MQKKSKYTLFLLIVFGVLCVIAQVFAQDAKDLPLVSPELLQAGKLQMLWQNKLPIKQGEILKKLQIIDDRIYAFSDRNYVVSLDREKNNVIFSRPVTEAGLPIKGWELYDGEIFSVAGNKLIEIDSELGTDRNSRSLSFSVICPPARNELRYYLAGLDRRMHVLREADKIQLFEVATGDESLITTILADDSAVFFGTDSGRVKKIAPGRPQLIWSFKATGGIVGPMLKDSEFLLFASKDTHVYKLNAETGFLAWNRPMGAVLDVAPRLTNKVVYQYVRDKGLASINKENGQLIWQLPEGIDLLAEKNDLAYVFTKEKTLVVMDNRKALKLYSVNFASVTKYAANTLDSKIYIADESGRIACLMPLE